MSQNLYENSYDYFLTQMSQLRFFDDEYFDFVLPTCIKGVSDDNFLGAFFCPKPEYVETVILPAKQPEITEETSCIPQFNKYVTARQEKKREFGKQKKDYKKNICGYITKKIVREFMAPVYKQKVLELCTKYDCEYLQCLEYYDKKIERITGPTHLDMLLNSCKEGSKMKKCFRQFFIWFLRHRYLRYLIMEGKMERKDIYIDYKNKNLLYLGSAQQQIEYNLSCNESESRQTNSMFSN